MKKPPKLQNDCFALPQGIYWTPVDECLVRLKNCLSVVVGEEKIKAKLGIGRILSQDIFAFSSTPPFANSAVDGYGFLYASCATNDLKMLELVPERAAAGQGFFRDLKPGTAVRILTGAQVPSGVDTVVLQEDVRVSDGYIHFETGLKQGANIRKVGEDVLAKDLLFKSGHKIKPQDMALIAATGLSEYFVFLPLKIGVLSTGNEVVSKEGTKGKDAIYDANRPMLLNLLSTWGYEAIDLGHSNDDMDLICEKFDQNIEKLDAIITTGGVSSGDEDYISKILSTKADLQTWRVAMKPGRPFALGIYKSLPIFGLPGNPVAAFICSLIFARPAFNLMSGALWLTPLSYQLPARFSKHKKSGRREYLRARLNENNEVEVFASEGSGRVSGLSWATGLVELSDEAQDINHGDLVKYIPYTSFGI